MKIRWSFLTILILTLTCCSPFEFLESQEEFLKKKIALKAAQPFLEKAFWAEAAVLPSSRGIFPTVSKLPGSEVFDWKKSFTRKMKVTKDGVFQLSPGDYLFPVMTYCMKSSGSSPSHHRYTLSRIQGTAAKAIRDLHAKGTRFFPSHDIQVVSWEIQNGISYQNMPLASKKIIDQVIPEHIAVLQKSNFAMWSEKWNSFADKTTLVPRTEALTDELLDSLGEFGSYVRSVLRFRNEVASHGHDYDTLRNLISLPGNSSTEGGEQNTPWSQLAPNTFARFVTDGRYQQMGQFQVRITPTSRSPKGISTDPELTSLDISALAADPDSGGIQPLGFSVMAGMAEITALEAINPLYVAAILATLIAAENVDWEAVAKAVQSLSDSTAESVKELLEKINTMQNKQQDKLEQPARDCGVIDSSMKPTKDKDKTRTYEKPGGSAAVEKDFNKFPGETKTSSDGVKYKDLPNGDRVVARPFTTSKETPPTIEIQPKSGDRTRVKIRYP